MEQVHGVDVSWMTQASPKDKVNKKPPSPPPSPPASQQPNQTTPKPTSAESKPAAQTNPQTNGHGTTPPTTNGPTPPMPRRRSRSGSVDKYGPNGTPPGRRNSWFSNISAKFSSNHNAQGGDHHVAGQQKDTLPEQEEDDEMPPPPSIHPRVSPVGARSAVLPPATKPNGNAPYTPAPPRSSQPGFLGVFRRLSSSGPSGHAGAKLGNGLVERKILNVDRNRQRCPMPELKDAKLRKVSFCVDVEIAPMPKYAEGDAPDRSPVDNTQKKKLTEKGEGDALKNPKAMEEHKETEGILEPKVVETPREPAPTERASDETLVADDAKKDDPTLEKKKEKKKKSEGERKARKEKKRKLAEANGSIPMEIYYSSDSSSEQPAAPTSRSGSGLNTPTRTQQFPTTNPVRIYRRCCQLRETPILKKITEQLLDESNSSAATGMVNKLDLTGYWLQTGDVVTLGDYLAVVPVRELILENSNLNDEGLRMVLAGLLAARRPDTRRRKPKHELEAQGGVIERLVIKNNKLGPDGWKHLSLFIYLCNSLKYLDVSRIQFPRQAACQTNGQLPNGAPVPLGPAQILSKALSERLGGSTLELLNLGETEPTMDQFGKILDGVINCGIKRLGLSHNHLDESGVEHLSRYLSSGVCEGLDLGGNDLGNHMEQIISNVKDTDPLWALSLAGCDLTPVSLCKILPTLSKLTNLRFIDLSRNHALFESNPSAVGMLRRYIPKMAPLKRIHLQDVGMTAEQAIAIVEVISENQSLAHVNILQNAELMKLADARTEDEQEEACALFASLLAATRLSKTLVCVDIEVPGEQAGEIVKAMARQVVAYCLRNMETLPDADITAAVASALNESQGGGDRSKGVIKPAGYPDVLAHLVGHDVLEQGDSDDGQDPAPDEDYVIGGTGVVRALACCLKNRGDESRRPSCEFIREIEGGETTDAARLVTGGRAKDMSKHLLAGARKIRHRIQPALVKARTTSSDEVNLRKLVFLDDTLKGIIKRFEDEYPDTRETFELSESTPATLNVPEILSTTPPEEAAEASDIEDESKIHPARPRPLSRTNSALSRVLDGEEGHSLRIGHRFRSGFFTKEHIDLVTSNIDDIGSDPQHLQMLTGMAEDIGGELLETMKEKGPVRTFKEDHEMVMRCMKEADPEYWDRFIDSQMKARANISVTSDGKAPADESAVAD